MSSDNLFNVEKLEGAVLIHLGENLDGGSSALEFQNTLNELINNSDKILLDLSKVQTMNSSGLGMLVSAHTSVAKSNKDLILCSVPDKVFNLIQMTHLDKVLKIEKDVNSAL